MWTETVKSLLECSDIWLIGGGGKTTLMFRLAAAWVARGKCVICTTSTKIWPPAPDQCPDLRIADFETLLTDLHRRPSAMVTVAQCIENGKCCGFSPEEIMVFKMEAEHLVVEADGSAGRPVKAHAPHEPVIAAGAECVVAVVGTGCVGALLDKDHVHRPELFSELSGRKMGDLVTADDVACVILNEKGWLRAVPSKALFHVVVTGTDAGIAKSLAHHPNVSRISGIHCL